jgi:ABC-type antimicrobial peptide transport system permease subunit
MTLVVKAASDAPPVLPLVRDELRRLDPNIPIERPATLESLLARSFEGRRLPMLFLGPFALAALALAAVGVYGVLALAVRERTREIGIRIALGARDGDVRRLVLGRAALVTGAGLAAGAVASLIATRALKSLLFGVASTDPATFAAVTAGVAAVALAASWMPARRAARIDPMAALRAD